MRRAAQFYLQNENKGRLRLEELDSALEEILFGGGSLNAKLLGGSALSRETVN